MYEIKQLIDMIINAVEVEKYTTYERIAKESEISVVQLWKIRKNKQKRKFEKSSYKVLQKGRKCAILAI